jgi:hypothetical protein
VIPRITLPALNIAGQLAVLLNQMFQAARGASFLSARLSMVIMAVRWAWMFMAISGLWSSGPIDAALDLPGVGRPCVLRYGSHQLHNGVMQKSP